MYLAYEQITVAAAVLTQANLAGLAVALGAGATHAELQADLSDVRYTMDNATDPTVATGMLLIDGSDPKTFLIEDVQRIRFIRNGAVDAALNVHYFGGRNI